MSEKKKGAAANADEALDEIKERLEDFGESLAAAVRKKPLQALAAASVAGLILGLLLRGRDR